MNCRASDNGTLRSTLVSGHLLVTQWVKDLESRNSPDLAVHAPLMPCLPDVIGACSIAVLLLIKMQDPAPAATAAQHPVKHSSRIRTHGLRGVAWKWQPSGPCGPAETAQALHKNTVCGTCSMMAAASAEQCAALPRSAELATTKGWLALKLTKAPDAALLAPLAERDASKMATDPAAIQGGCRGVWPGGSRLHASSQRAHACCSGFQVRSWTSPDELQLRGLAGSRPQHPPSPLHPRSRRS